MPDAPTNPTTSREVIVVPHTHWDREWYAAFQTFRMKLVDLVDGLIPLLDNDPGFAHFQLDGQTAVVDDYLAIRPEREADLRRLAAAGRLSMGPWHILMDEFLVSGETIIRDLQLGLHKAAAFGGAMPVGYLPDMFGHIAQMPQILAQAGFEHTVVWRGVPAAVEKHAFWWDAPDGSRLRAEYLLEGYGNGSVLPDDAKELVAMLDRYVDTYSTFLPEGAPILWMNGTDHLFPKVYLGRVVAEANDLQDRYQLRVGSLADYTQIAPTHALSSWQGELRSGARANLLMGVTSNRTDIRQAAAGAERQLERLAEPLSALLLPPEEWPGPYLAEAWTQMVLNSAHDSICACSIDEVVDAVAVRFAEARQIGEGLTKRAVHALGASLAATGSAIVNPSARARSGVVTLTTAGHDDITGTQVLHRRGGDHRAGGLTVADVATLAPTAVNNMPELYDASLEIEADGTVELTLYADPDRSGPPFMPAEVTELVRIADEHPATPAVFTVKLPASQKVLAYVPEVPGFGWSVWHRDAAADLPPDVQPVVVDDTGAPEGGVHIGNALVEIDVDHITGTFSLDGNTGMNRLVDDGDTGDTYNYNPPTNDRVIDQPESVTVRVLERGPLRVRVAIDRTYRLPARAVKGDRIGDVPTVITSTVEVQAGSPLVWVTTELDNQSADHRLRVVFPLPHPATESQAECAFAVVSRSLDAEGGPTEKALATYPSRRFVAAGGLTVIHDGLPEYELVERGGDEAQGPANAMAITLLRCTGLISQGPMPYRPLPAGPVTPALGAQLPGRHTLRYALLQGDNIPAAYAAADVAFTPLQVTRARGTGSFPAQGTALDISGAEVSAVVREAGALVVRVFNPSAQPTVVQLPGRHGWLVDLRGRAIEPFEGSFPLAAWRIATVRIND